MKEGYLLSVHMFVVHLAYAKFFNLIYIGSEHLIDLSINHLL